MSFLIAFEKTAVINLPDAAAEAYNNSFQTFVPGSELNKETGQARGRATRTQGVQNEDKQFAKKYKHDWDNVRNPGKKD